MAKQNTGKATDPIARVRYFFEHNRIPNSHGPLLVAVSGGPDSVCLFHILFKLQANSGLKLHVVHLNHRLRGDEADDDARYVGELARYFGIPATIESRDVKAFRASERLSLEEAAREVRYNFFAEVAKTEQANAVAVGHTLDDNIETILMHLIRGTGTRGLHGLSPVTQWHSTKNSLMIIRPLLDISRRETQQYCRDNELEIRTDTTNTSLSLFRNRVRLELRPLLETYNPQINEALLRMANIAGDDITYLDKEGKRRWKKTVTSENDSLILNRERMLALPPALKRLLLRMAVENKLGTLKDIETRHIEEMLAILEKPAGRSINLPGGLTFSVEYDRYILGPEISGLCPFTELKGEGRLKIPGETVFSGWQITATVISEDKIKLPGIDKFIKNPGEIKNERESGFSAYFDCDRLGDELTIRTVQTGDRFQPLGMNEIKKVSRFMIDAKIPRTWRSRVPIITSQEQIIWVAGWRIDERVKVTDETKKIVSLIMKTG
jgi:tRNA(Ile)-lysidine synthase